MVNEGRDGGWGGIEDAEETETSWDIILQKYYFSASEF